MGFFLVKLPSVKLLTGPVPSGHKPLAEHMLTEIYVGMRRHGSQRFNPSAKLIVKKNATFQR